MGGYLAGQFPPLCYQGEGSADQLSIQPNNAYVALTGVSVAVPAGSYVLHAAVHLFTINNAQWRIGYTVDGGSNWTPLAGHYSVNNNLIYTMAGSRRITLAAAATVQLGIWCTTGTTAVSVRNSTDFPSRIQLITCKAA